MKKLTSFFLTVVLIAAGVGFYFGRNAINKKIASSPPEDYYGFFKTDESEPEFYSADFIRNLNIDADKYSSDIYYERLNEKEQLIYKAFLYAAQESYECVFFDSRVTRDNTYDPIRILDILSLSSPLIEQNMRISYQKCEYTVKFGPRFFEHAQKYEGTRYILDCFNEESMAKKEQAIAQAQAFLQTLDCNSTDKKELARAIYEKFAGSVKYKKYDNPKENHDYLYDALIKHESQCDGFANAVSLLYNMAGIECFEKMYLPEDDSEGHTWNTVMIDGLYYNIDITSDPRVKDDSADFEIFPVGFGFTDSLQGYRPDFPELLPECNGGNLFGSQKIDMSANSAEREFEKLFKKSGDMFAFTFNAVSEKRVTSVLQSACNRMQKNFRYEQFGGIEEDVIVIYKKD